MKASIYLKRILFGLTLLAIISLSVLFNQAVSQEQGKPTNNEDTSGQGELKALDKDGKPIGNCPLKHTDVSVEISGYVARVNVTQQFENPFKDKIEAIYTFPLSSDGAVDDMLMKVGARTIKGQIKKREEARQIYEAAKNSGRVASLLDQERPNIFTQSVANIMPGESVTITISYVEILKYEDGEYNFVFPMVVGPRYMPGSPAGHKGTGWARDTNQVPDASKISPPVTPEGVRAGHDISVTVNLNAGTSIKRISSKLHEIETVKTNDSAVKISLKNQKTIPNKDFILNWEVAGDKIEDAFMTTAHKGKDGFFTFILQPPKRPAKSDITPKEMVFVIDCSGSMRGYPIETAKKTMRLCIELMNPDDTFNITAYANNQAKLFETPQPNSKENCDKGLDFLATRTGGGGTEMLPCINAVLDPPEDPKRLRIVCFMTDGFVGNDMQILGAIKNKLGNARLFSFGIGSSVNRFLLDNMALMGRGEVDYVSLKEKGDGAAERFHERISCPLLTDISIDWNGLAVADVYPKNIPDLFSAKPLVLKGRYTASGKGEITLKGKIAGKEYSRKIKVEFPEDNPDNNSLGSLWARARIDDLMSTDWESVQMGKPKDDIKNQITHLGLEFRLMTQYTSFVAVEEMIITDGGKARTIAVPVEMPEGVSYEGVFGTNQGANWGTAKRSPRARPMQPSVMPSSGPVPGNQSPQLSPATVPSDGLDSIPLKEPKTAEEKIKARLDNILQGLAEKVAKEGKDGNLKLSGCEVVNNKIEIKIYLKNNSAKKIEELKKLGVEILVESKVIKIVIARIDVGKLNDLAQIDNVRFVTPVEIK
jgi:Ca-activated chloride channel family protein